MRRHRTTRSWADQCCGSGRETVLKCPPLCKRSRSSMHCSRCYLSSQPWVLLAVRLVLLSRVRGSFGMLIRRSSRFGPYPCRSRSRSLGAADPVRSQHTLDRHLSTGTKTRVYTRAAADRLARTRREFIQVFPFSLETSTLTLLSRAGPHFRPVLGFTLSPRRESKPATPRLAGELVRGPLLEERRSPNEIDQKPTLQRGR